MHIWIEGMDGSGSTQKVTLGIYADDGVSGLPGTKFGESDVEISVAGSATADWVKVTPAAPIRVTGAHAWLAAISGTPGNRLRYAVDTITNALVYGPDVYEAAAPRLANPFGTGSLANSEVSMCADYDVESGTSPPPGDTTAPVLREAASSVSGALVVLEYNEPLLTTSVPNAGDFAVRVDGIARAVSTVTVIGSNVQLLLSTPVDHQDTLELDYNRDASRAIKDLAGNMALSLADIPIVNATSPDDEIRTTTQVRVTSISRIVDPTARTAGTGGGGI
jgi:uncharacterized repeat protein (TIGR02059 family)